jgi:hypothetical protein
MVNSSVEDYIGVKAMALLRTGFDSAFFTSRADGDTKSDRP